jgi:caffeoyl-CoA O-methyltransferase
VGRKEDIKYSLTVGAYIMSDHIGMSKALEHYVVSHTRETALAARLRRETAKLPRGGMQTMPDQVAFLALLVRLMSARRIIEIGTFTGYSALGMASALPAGGKLITCDTSREWTDVAQRYWSEAGIRDRIDLRIASADKTLADLLSEGLAGSFDLVFIDADKTGYDGYYEASLKLLRGGGLIAFDNMLWSGAVADSSVQDADTQALRALNIKIRDDARVDSCLLTVADGMVLARKI